MKNGLSLAINTASSQTTIALLENGEALASESWESQNKEAEKLLPSIGALLQKNNHTYADLTAVLALQGPGSFTGLRVGISVANAFAYLLKCPLFAVTTFQYWHLLSNLPILIFAGKGAVYFSEKEAEPQQIDLPALNEFLAAKQITEFTGDITPDQIAAINAKFVPPNLSWSDQLIFVAQNMELKPVNLITPLYIKPPSITIKN